MAELFAGINPSTFASAKFTNHLPLVGSVAGRLATELVSAAVARCVARALVITAYVFELNENSLDPKPLPLVNGPAAPQYIVILIVAAFVNRSWKSCAAVANAVSTCAAFVSEVTLESYV